MKKEVLDTELAAAFSPERKSNKKGVSLGVLGLGIVTLGVGAVFLFLKLTAGPAVLDAEFLVEKGEWVLEGGCEEDEASAEGPNDAEIAAETEVEDAGCEAKVIWDFTEIGEGSLTTNGHKNDYEFKWAIKDGKLLIETEWLYELENEYDYKLNQNEGVLTLTDGGETYIFKHNML